jgi:hypothetical protein
MIIKKYNIYKESLNENEITLEKFANDLLDICHIIMKSRKPSSLWATNLARSNRDPQSDLNLFKQRMLNKGWDSTSIIELFNKEDVTKSIENLHERCQKIGTYPQIDNQNGMIDLYLMWCESISKKGYNFGFGGVGDNSEEEATIRYNYGYHRTKYGKLYIESTFGTMENFKDKAFRQIEIIFSESSTIPFLANRHNYSSSPLIQDMIGEGFIVKDEGDKSLRLEMNHIYDVIVKNGLIPEGVDYEEFVEKWIDHFAERFDSYSYNKTTLKLFL